MFPLARWLYVIVACGRISLISNSKQYLFHCEIKIIGTACKANRVSTLEYGDDLEHSANDISTLTRSESISRNLKFLAGLGFHGNQPSLVTTRNANFSKLPKSDQKTIYLNLHIGNL